MSADSAAGWGDLVTRRAAPHLLVVCFGVWLHAADGLLVATMSPAILADIGGAPLLAWTLTLYELGSIVAGAAGGLLALRHGLRGAMCAAALLFALGCAVAALAPRMEVLLAGRLLQGLGGGGLMALAFVAVSALFPRSQMPLVLAAVSALWGLSAFLGPLVGGVFAEAGLWRGGFWFFAAQAGLLAAGIAVALRHGADLPGGAGRLPVQRLALLALAILAVAAAGVGATPLVSAPLVAAGLGIFVAFLRADDRREADRLLPRRALDPRDPLGAGLLMVLLVSAATVPLVIYGPLMLVRLHGASALTAGYVIAIASIGWSVAAVLVAGVPERRDDAFIRAGMAILAAAVAGYAVALVTGPVWLVALFAAAEGIGFGMSWTFILRRAIGRAAADDAERLASALPTVQRIGYALGAAWAGLVSNAAGIADDMSRPELARGGAAVFAACWPLALAALPMAFRFTRRP